MRRRDSFFRSSPDPRKQAEQTIATASWSERSTAPVEFHGSAAHLPLRAPRASRPYPRAASRLPAAPDSKRREPGGRWIPYSAMFPADRRRCCRDRLSGCSRCYPCPHRHAPRQPIQERSRGTGKLAIGRRPQSCAVVPPRCCQARSPPASVTASVPNLGCAYGWRGAFDARRDEDRERAWLGGDDERSSPGRIDSASRRRLRAGAPRRQA
jgi:hypothetical protein